MQNHNIFFKICRYVRHNTAFTDAPPAEDAGQFMILLVFLLYLLMLLGIGIYCARLNRNLDDFVLGGRRLGPWVTAISAQASDMSSWLLIGLPGAAYASGLSVLWAVIGCAAGTVFNWLVIAPRMRDIAGRHDCLTVPDILEAKLGGGKNPAIRITTVLIIIVFYVTYISAQFIAAGKVFEATFRDVATPWGNLTLTYEHGLWIGGTVIVAYTMLGGFLAVAYTDLIQGLLMVFAVVVLPIIGILNLPEGTTFLGTLENAGAHMLSISGGKAGSAFFFGVMIGGLAWGLGYPGQPHILTRFMAIKDPGKMKQAALIGIVWVFLALFGAFLVGLVGHGHFDGLADEETVMPLLTHKLLPPLLVGILISAAVAAMMSTVDSQMIIAVGALERDIMDKLLGIKLSGRKAVFFGRLVTVTLGAAGILVALFEENVFEQVLNAWGGLGAGLGPAVLLTLLWKNARTGGIICGMIAAITLVTFWKICPPPLPSELGYTSPPVLETGFTLNLAVAVAVSMLLNRRRRCRAPENTD